MLNWLIKNTICRWKGHRRGRRIESASGPLGNANRFECPRCKSTWTRKERKAAA